MKEFKQGVGKRPWHGNEFVALQMENLDVIQAYFKEFGNCIIQGCEITNSATPGKYDIAAGIVGVNWPEGYKVGRFPAVTGVDIPGYFAISKQDANKNYQTSGSQLASSNYVIAYSAGAPPSGSDIYFVVPDPSGGSIARPTPYRFIDRIGDKSISAPVTIVSGTGVVGPLNLKLRTNYVTKQLIISGSATIKNFNQMPGNDVLIGLAAPAYVPAIYRPDVRQNFTVYITDTNVNNLYYRDFSNSQYVQSFTGYIDTNGSILVRFMKPVSSSGITTVGIEFNAIVSLI